MNLISLLKSPKSTDVTILDGLGWVGLGFISSKKSQNGILWMVGAGSLLAALHLEENRKSSGCLRMIYICTTMFCQRMNVISLQNCNNIINYTINCNFF
jgi:hypothetical protein